jgi:hypothetical protein
MKKYVVITSINPPNDVIEQYAARTDIRLVVAGDRKSPSDWQFDGVDYLSAETQIQMGGALAQCLPWNHYCRKLMGYLHAIRQGAEIIIDTDDDNYPLQNWEFPDFKGKYDSPESPDKFFNIYRAFTDVKVWPRGYPLDDVTASYDRDRICGMKQQDATVGIWQGLADEDPDVDAIYRLTDYTYCEFEKRPPVVLPRGVYCPFNSQNTAFRKELFALLYLPSTVTFRFTDILRGYVAQPALWRFGYQLGFIEATVRQARNPHDLMADFESELPCYLSVSPAIACCEKAAVEAETISEYMRKAYGYMFSADIVREQELVILDSWLEALEDVQS